MYTIIIIIIIIIIIMIGYCCQLFFYILYCWISHIEILSSIIVNEGYYHYQQ